MRKTLLTLCLTIFIVSCAGTKYITITSTPPAEFEIHEIKTNRDLISEYRKSVMKVAEWQKWYNVEIGSNYYK